MFAAALTDQLPSPDVIAAVIGALLPVVIALATHVGAGDRVRGLVATVLGILAGPVATWIAGNEAILSKVTASNAIAAYALSLVTYFTTWRPVFDINARVLPNVGLGKPKS